MAAAVALYMTCGDNEWGAEVYGCASDRQQASIVFDVAVDLRQDSSTFGKWFGIELTPENKLQLYVPRGFGHGFSALSETAVFAYKCDNFYHKESEGSVIWNDPDLNIDWKLPVEDVILSEKDKILPTFAEKNY